MSHISDEPQCTQCKKSWCVCSLLDILSLDEVQKFANTGDQYSGSTNTVRDGGIAIMGCYLHFSCDLSWREEEGSSFIVFGLRIALLCRQVPVLVWRISCLGICLSVHLYVNTCLNTYLLKKKSYTIVYCKQYATKEKCPLAVCFVSVYFCCL